MVSRSVSYCYSATRIDDFQNKALKTTGITEPNKIPDGKKYVLYKEVSRTGQWVQRFDYWLEDRGGTRWLGHCATSWKVTDSLKLLEPSGPVQACNGIALPIGQSDLDWIQDTFFFSALELLNHE